MGRHPARDFLRFVRPRGGDRDQWDGVGVQALRQVPGRLSRRVHRRSEAGKPTKADEDKSEGGEAGGMESMVAPKPTPAPIQEPMQKSEEEEEGEGEESYSDGENEEEEESYSDDDEESYSD